MCGQFHVPAILTSGKEAPLHDRMGEPHSHSGYFKVKRNLFPLLVIEARFLSHPVQSHYRLQHSFLAILAPCFYIMQSCHYILEDRDSENDNCASRSLWEYRIFLQLGILQ